MSVNFDIIYTNMAKLLFTMLFSCALAVAAQAVSVLEKGWKSPAENKNPAPAEKAVPAPAEKAAPVSAEKAAPAPAEKEAAAPKQVEVGKNSADSRPVKITSDSTVYNRKEGLACFEGNVYVEDAEYQMHADRVFLMMDGTNELNRIVAIGNVAMTNEQRRAYGAKMTYSKKSGLVVLYSGDGIVAEVRDEAKEGDQVVRGDKIRFWIDAEQVEVDNADISAPSSAGGGAGSLKKVIGK